MDIQQMQTEKAGVNKFLVGVIALLVFAVGYLLIAVPENLWPFEKGSEQVVCTLDAKQCPDGSYVGRTGPNCEFSVCPGTTSDATVGWKTYSNAELGYEFKYPSMWTVDTYGLSQAAKEVFVSPPSPAQMQAYFSVVVDSRSLEQVRTAFGPGLDSGAIETSVTISGRSGYLFTNSLGRYLFFPSSSVPGLGIDVSNSVPENSQILSTFKFTDTNSGSKIYKNTQFGFELDLTQSWSNYVVRTESYDGATAKIQIAYSNSAQLPEQAFEILVYTQTQWDAEMKLDQPHPKLLKRSNNYTFATPFRYETSGLPGESDIEQILSSFRVI